MSLPLRVARIRPGCQLPLALPNTWGGRREGAGRKRGPGRPVCVLHRTRPQHRADHPVHITLRADRRLRVLRYQRVFRAVRGAIAAVNTSRGVRLSLRAASRHEGCLHRQPRAQPQQRLQQQYRIVAFSVQADHVHLIVEATGRAALSSGMRGLTIRIARAVNRVLGRRGSVWSDRYHRRDLATPREVRNALVYVLMNHKKHLWGIEGQQPFDPCSSAAWFDGWARGRGPSFGSGLPRAASTRARGQAPRPPRDSTNEGLEPEQARDHQSEDPAENYSDNPPVAPPRTWLLRVGWRRYGLLRSSERPSRS